MADKRAKRRQEISAVREAAETDGSLITDFTQEGFTLTFTLNAPKDSNNVTLNIPDEYPTEGHFTCYDSHGERNLGLSSIKRIINDLVEEFAKAQGVNAVPTFPGEPAPVFEKEDDAGPAPGGEVSFVPKGDPSGCKDRLLQVIERYNKSKKDHPSVGYFLLPTKDIIVRIPVNLSWLGKQTASIWGIDNTRTVIVDLQIAEPFYLRGRDRPKVKVYQTTDTDFSQRHVNEHSFGLQWLVQKRVEYQMTWPIRDEDTNPEEWLPSVVAHCCDAVRHCNKSCMICHENLEYVGLKPAVCGKPLCTFSHMQFGLGEDVVSALNAHPEVMDLLISLTVSASNADVNRFNPYPAGLEVTIREEGAKDVKVLSFMKGPDLDTDRDNVRVQQALAHFTEVQRMASFPNSKKLQEALDVHDRLTFPLLRWIISSCRAHLAPLAPSDRFSEMNTPFQFVFLSTPPEIEQKFTALKKEHGSILAWHGSTFSNWHSIFRMGLKNYSGHKLQSHGAAYGAGIYLAADAATSLGYAHNVNGWDKSLLGKTTFQGLALCEIIDYKVDGQAKYSANPYYVIPDEDHVLTRFFFVFPQGTSASAPAQQLRGHVDKVIARLSKSE
eukprot:TRINITY_DN14524_c0_g1_i1.p1 TRINITY_DN14524_c0_g1~~TRINITY_DN14524_c0_g1_i1.p1  ORF type:complete len:609 (-),score=127.86 TRINITY_DN14524_c0_g1_i1:51-1877(-)